MPELKNEIPTSPELIEYFEGHWQAIGKTIEEVFFETGVDGSKLTKKIYESILASLFRLNALPRENQFWNNTNKKPTIHKLNEFCELLLKENKKDDLALWTLFSLGQFWGSSNFEPNEWISFWEDRKADVEILILTYLYDSWFYDVDTTGISSWLTKLDCEEKAIPQLQVIKRSKNDQTQKWAEEVLKIIQRK